MTRYANRVERSEMKMKYSEVINEVRQRADLDGRNEAERVVTTTLEVLGQRLAGHEPSNLGAQLPPELNDLLTQHTGAAEDYDLEEFVRRVAERQGCTPEEARQRTRAVMETIADFVSEGEINDLRSQLPAGYESLLAR